MVKLAKLAGLLVADSAVRKAVRAVEVRSSEADILDQFLREVLVQLMCIAGSYHGGVFCCYSELRGDGGSSGASFLTSAARPRGITGWSVLQTSIENS